MYFFDIFFWLFVEYVLLVYFWGIDLYLLFDVFGECMMICKLNNFFFWYVDFMKMEVWLVSLF